MFSTWRKICMSGLFCCDRAKNTRAKFWTGAQFHETESLYRERRGQKVYSRISSPTLFYNTRNKCRQLREVLSTEPVPRPDRNQHSLYVGKKQSPRQLGYKILQWNLSLRLCIFENQLTLYWTGKPDLGYLGTTETKWIESIWLLLSRTAKGDLFKQVAE